MHNSRNFAEVSQPLCITNAHSVACRGLQQCTKQCCANDAFRLAFSLAALPSPVQQLFCLTTIALEQEHHSKERSSCLMRLHTSRSLQLWHFFSQPMLWCVSVLPLSSCPKKLDARMSRQQRPMLKQPNIHRAEQEGCVRVVGWSSMALHKSRPRAQ
eukprot:875428-Pelagomonas_calceolata.AAC.4